MDRDLNRDVALALGWTPTIEVHHFASGAPYEREVWPTESGSLPAFSSYLAAAMTLVHRLVADGWYFRLEAYNATDQWRAVFKKDGIRYSAYEATAAATITAAFLAAQRHGDNVC